MTKPFLTIDYDEYDVSSYRGIVVTYEGKTHRFFSGDYDQDAEDFDQWRIENRIESWLHSSSLDNWNEDRATAAAVKH